MQKLSFGILALTFQDISINYPWDVPENTLEDKQISPGLVCFFKGKLLFRLN